MAGKSASEQRGATETGRIVVRRGASLVPLLSTVHPPFEKSQPWSGVLLERHHVTPSEIPEHEHPDLCLHLQISGTEDFEWWSNRRNQVERTRPGSLILIPAGTRDRLRWTGSSDRLIVSLRHDRLRELAEQSGAPSTPEFKQNWALHDPALENILAEMGQQAFDQWPLGSLYADLLALGLITKLARTHAVNPIDPPAQRGGLSIAKLRQAMEYISADLAEDIRLEAIAKELNLSPSHFAHEFRNSSGQTPYQYLLSQRMSRAQQLLKQTSWTVQSIGEQVGYRSPVNFARAFRQRFGVAPAAWRRSL
jgi:AraC family transcriptional regulator